MISVDQTKQPGTLKWAWTLATLSLGGGLAFTLISLFSVTVDADPNSAEGGFKDAEVAAVKERLAKFGEDLKQMSPVVETLKLSTREANIAVSLLPVYCTEKPNSSVESSSNGEKNPCQVWEEFSKSFVIEECKSDDSNEKICVRFSKKLFANRYLCGTGKVKVDVGYQYSPPGLSFDSIELKQTIFTNAPSLKLPFDTIPSLRLYSSQLSSVKGGESILIEPKSYRLRIDNGIEGISSSPVYRSTSSKPTDAVERWEIFVTNAVQKIPFNRITLNEADLNTLVGAFAVERSIGVPQDQRLIVSKIHDGAVHARFDLPLSQINALEGLYLTVENATIRVRSDLDLLKIEFDAPNLTVPGGFLQQLRSVDLLQAFLGISSSRTAFLKAEISGDTLIIESLAGFNPRPPPTQ